MSRGQRCYERVEHYASLGHHRTGSDVDKATAAWVAEIFASNGLNVRQDGLAFECWSAQSQLHVDGIEVDHLQLYYEWTGAVLTDDVHVASFDPMSGGLPGAADGAIGAALDSGSEAAVLATDHPNGALVALNRQLAAQPSNLPVVLIAGREFDRVATGSLRLEMTATLKTATTTNIIGSNDLDGAPLVLTTPLNGWFRCAGERGTGIAVLFELIERFGDRPLRVIATGGHELGYFGVHRFVDEHIGDDYSSIAHIGASVAVEEDSDDGTRRLAANRMAMTTLHGSPGDALTAALADTGLYVHTATDQWIGEGEAWSRIDVPLLSFTGAGIDFHTPEDTPQRATSPAALETMVEAIGDAIEVLDDYARRR